MRHRDSSAPLRASLLLVLLASGAFAGCFDDEPDRPLAQPTDEPPQVPTRPSPRAPTIAYNFSDPGYRVDAPWRVGDGWDYESNESRFRRVRVVDSRLASGTTFYVLEEKTGEIGLPPSRTTLSWVEGRQWLLLNASDVAGEDRYQPGLPLRYFRNGSFAFNHTRVETSGRVSLNESIAVQSRLAAQHTTILIPAWGYVEAKRIDQIATVRGSAGDRTQATTVHWVHRDYANDVQYQLPSGETYKLTAVKVGDFRRGTLQS